MDFRLDFRDRDFDFDRRLLRRLRERLDVDRFRERLDRRPFDFLLDRLLRRREMRLRRCLDFDRRRGIFINYKQI